DAAEVDQFTQVGRVVGQHVALTAATGRAVVSRDAVLHRFPDVGEPGLLPHRTGTRAAELDAVVGGRVVAGGEHRAGQLQRPGGEVQLVGAGQADRHHVDALRDDTIGE